MANSVYRIRSYCQAIPEILNYQLVSKLLLTVMLFVFRRMAGIFLSSTGRTAITSGDFLFVFQTWQGWLLILLAMAVLYTYVIFDINVMILYSASVIHQKELSIWRVIWEALLSIRAFLNWRGLLVVLYLSLLIPLIGFGFTISLTEKFIIPKFISSVIYANSFYLIAYIILLFILLVIGIRNIFLIHGVVLKGESIQEAGRRSKEIIKTQWRNFLPRYILFMLGMGLLVVFVFFLLVLLPQVVIFTLDISETIKKFLTIFLCFIGLTITGYTALITTPMQILELTRLFYCYSDRRNISVPENPKKHRLRVGINLLLCLVTLAVSFLLTVTFDTVFPADHNIAIIAHRGGGTLAAENSIAGLEQAAAHHAYGSEIDVQRTKDGHYIINHDNTFKRLYGVDQTPMAMTLSEIRNLSIKNGAESVTVSTLEEMLDAARRQNVKLYIELKGKSADQQMADDVVSMIRARNMENQCVIISLNYPILAYIEEHYPDIETGLLYYAAFGDVSALHVDDLILEEQAVSHDIIQMIHRAGKKVIVWTVNTSDAMRRFLNSDVDAIITDEVAMAEERKAALSQRSYLERIWDTMLYQW